MKAPPITQRRRRKRGERGQALVEFAIVSVAFFMLAFGIIDGARLFESWVTVQHAAREGARYAITGQVNCDGVTDDRDQCITNKALTSTTGISGGGIDGTEVSVSFSSWAYPDYADPPSDGNSGEQCDAIEVQVSYTHEFMSPILQAIVPDGITISGRQRMINEPFGPCE